MMGTKTSTINRIKNATAKRDESDVEIGVLAMWTLRDFSVTVTGLKARYVAAGLNEDGDLFPPAIRPDVAFHKALRQARGKTNGLLVRKIVNTDDRIVVGLVREDKDEINTDLEYGVEAKVAFFKPTDSAPARVAVSGSGTGRAVGERIVALYNEMTTTYVGTDMLRTLTRAMHRFGAVNLRGAGGVYLVPSVRGDDARRLQQVVEGVGDSEFVLVPIFGTAESKANLAKKTRRALHEELEALNAEIEEFKTKPPRRDTLQRRLEEYKELKKRARMYADMLSFKADSIVAGLGECSRAIASILGDVEADTAERKKSKKTSRGTRRIRRTVGEAA
jgi:hypothetical protein